MFPRVIMEFPKSPERDTIVPGECWTVGPPWTLLVHVSDVF